MTTAGRHCACHARLRKSPARYRRIAGAKRTGSLAKGLRQPGGYMIAQRR
jgi:hypothetical protein